MIATLDGVLKTANSNERMAVLFDRHAPGALRLAYLLTGRQEQAEDLVQDAFVKMFGRWQDLRKPEAFEAYLKKTIVNLARNQWRRGQVEKAHLLRERGAATVTTFPDVEGRAELMGALAALPPRQRAVVVLRYFEDLSEAQTAALLDCSLSAVKSASLRGLNALRARLERGDA